MSAPVRVAIVTLSDTRTAADDEGGALLRSLLEAAGFMIVAQKIEREDLEGVRMAVAKLARREDVDAVITTGGTGLAPRDITIQAIEPLIDKPVPGFGEAFRRLSFDEIGPRAILSSALAGVVRGRLVIALPGSPNAVRLAVDKLIAPTLRHAVDVASGRTHHGPTGRG